MTRDTPSILSDAAASRGGFIPAERLVKPVPQAYKQAQDACVTPMDCRDVPGRSVLRKARAV